MRTGIQTLRDLTVIRKLTVQFVFVGVAILGLVLSPIATQRAAAVMTCNSQQICMWEHSYGGGLKITYTGLSRFQCWNLPSGWYDRVSSIYNRMNYGVYFYSLTGCGGWSHDLGGGQLTSDLSGTGMNDEIRSFWTN